MALYRESAVVLRTIRLGEADRIVTLMTEGRGKVRAVAKGVRKTKSRFGGRLEPIAHVALQLYEGRELDTVTQVETLDHFRTIREDVGRVGRATSVLEAVDQVSQQGEPNPALYRMLIGALRSLAARNSAALVAGFYWKLLSQEGIHPLLDVCATCGSGGPFVAFDLSQGGALCRVCRRGQPVSPETLQLVARMLGGDLAAVLAERPTPATAEAEQLAIRAVENHIERRLKSPGNVLVGEAPPMATGQPPPKGQ
ncbi:MAG: DNA repair protein RecO [Actinobacteria bacterium]|nr:DNA repair protein RecO [Actinomycetota bacterium]